MRKRLIGVLAFALAVSAGAAFVLYQLIASRMTVGASAKPATNKVWVASRDMEPGALVTERDLRNQDYLSVPPGALTKKEDILSRGVTAPIHEDSPFYDTSLAPKGAGAGFAATIPKGMRAFAVHVNEVVGVSGFAVTGMHVDVLVSGQPPGGSGENAAATGNITRTLLQDLVIMSAGQNYQKDAEGKPVLVQVVNLLVTPDQAEMLTLATQQTLQLVLRNPTDRDVVNTPGAATANLFGGKIRTARVEVEGSGQPSPPRPVVRAVEPPAPPAKPRTVTVEVFSGPTRSESTFIDPGSSPGPYSREAVKP